MEADLFDQFWSAYPNDLCNRKASKKKAKESWDKLDPEIQQRVVTNIREMIRADRAAKKANEFVPRWPMVATWLNQERWEDIVDIRQRTDKPESYAKECKCGSPAEHINQCWSCYDKDSAIYKQKIADLKGVFIKNGLLHSETKAERADRCKDFLRSKGYLGSLIPERA